MVLNNEKQGAEHTEFGDKTAQPRPMLSVINVEKKVSTTGRNCDIFLPLSRAFHAFCSSKRHFAAACVH